MAPLDDVTATVVGAGTGVGRATALALSARGARVTAVARHREPLEAVQREARGPMKVRVLDATDRAAVDGLIHETRPRVLVLSAGVRPTMAPIQDQSWESFSAPWNQDVRMAFELGRAALTLPLSPKSSVIFVSSGAGLGGSPLSGGYAGAKRMQMFLAGYLQGAADEAGLELRFVALVPRQFIVGTTIAEVGARAYAERARITPDAFMERFGRPLSADAVAHAVVTLAEEGPPGGVSAIGLTGQGTELL